jgi:hypothetical protein
METLYLSLYCFENNEIYELELKPHYRGEDFSDYFYWCESTSDKFFSEKFFNLALKYLNDEKRYWLFNDIFNKNINLFIEHKVEAEFWLEFFNSNNRFQEFKEEFLNTCRKHREKFLEHLKSLVTDNHVFGLKQHIENVCGSNFENIDSAEGDWIKIEKNYLDLFEQVTGEKYEGFKYTEEKKGDDDKNTGGGLPF